MFGLTFATENSVPGLEAYSGEQSADVTVSFHREATLPFRGLDKRIRYRSPEIGGHGAPTLLLEELANGSHLRLRYDDGAEFVLNRSGTRIFGTWGPESTPEDGAVYLFASVAGLLLRLRGTTCLHASAVQMDGQAAIFVGGSEAGKSTLAATFARLGVDLLTDDIAALTVADDAVLVQPGAPRVLLWPDSVEALWGSSEALPALVPNWDKRCLRLSGNPARFSAKPAPIRAIYVLDERVPGGTFRIDSLTGAMALVQLVANAYASHLIEPRQRAGDFAAFSRLVTHVPVRRISRPDDLGAVRAGCEEIIRDFEEITSESAWNSAVRV